MTFVAQIDSVEHQWKSNPHSVDALSDDQKWMFGDVGMIYVFFCFNCLEPHAEFECGKQPLHRTRPRDTYRGSNGRRRRRGQ